MRRCAQEEAARALRLAVHRRQILTAIVKTWPQGARRDDADWRALHALLPPGTPAAQIANRTRQVRAYRHACNGELPRDLADVETAPAVAAQVLLAAADRQLTTITRHDGRVVLRVQLPLTAQPRARGDWAWHILPVTLPPTVAADAKICPPTLRISGHRVRVDIPHRVAVTATKPSGHRLALGLDWGVKTLLTGVAGRLTDQGRVVTDGRMLRYDATAVSAKLHRLRGHREHLAALRDQHAALAAGLPATDPRTAHLHGLAERARLEHERVCARICHLNKTLAWSAARWAVDHAAALHATVIYIEDLATLQARGTRKGNARLSGQVRGTVFEAIHHLAAKTAIAVVTVPARGTSKYCPRCGTGTTELAHTPAPDRPDERGWKWAACPRCGLSADRDHAAAMRITARGLLAQTNVRTDRKTGRHATTATVEGNVATVRRPTPRSAKRPDAGRGPKNRPTPKRPPAPAPASKLSHRVPDRRTAPAPPSGGQRPAGQEPKNHHHPVAASGPAHELLNPRHHPTGFHHVHATTVTALSGDFGPGTTRPRPDRNV